MAARKIIMEFPLKGEPHLVDTQGFGKSCEEHIDEVARRAGADVTLMNPLPDLEREPEIRDHNVDHIQETES